MNARRVHRAERCIKIRATLSEAEDERIYAIPLVRLFVVKPTHKPVYSNKICEYSAIALGFASEFDKNK